MPSQNKDLETSREYRERGIEAHETLTKLRIKICEIDADRVRLGEQMSAVDREVDKLKRIQDRLNIDIRHIVNISGAGLLSA